MIIGVPREVKSGETRVAMTPALCRRLTALDVSVVMEEQAGAGAGYPDPEYRAAGASLVPVAAKVWRHADLILKVKEPQPAEYELMRPGQTLFTYLHLAAGKELARELCRRRVQSIAYESVEAGGGYPLLKPMSQVAGRLSVQIGAHFLQSPGGAGVLLGGIPGSLPGHVVVVGAGNSGAQAVQMAAGLGARVTVLDLDARRLEAVDTEYRGRVVTLLSNPANLEQAVADADLLIGAVLVPGARAPIVVTRPMVARMRPGSVIVDIAIDQGGCIEGITATSHTMPTFVRDKVIHYAVPNMPALAGRTATLGLTQATEPYIALLAQQGVQKALERNPGLARGVNTRDGRIVAETIARAVGFDGAT